MLDNITLTLARYGASERSYLLGKHTTTRAV